MILDLREQLDQLTITELVEAVLEKTGYVDILNAQATLESKARVEISKSFFLLPKTLMIIQIIRKKKLDWINSVASSMTWP